MRNGEEGLGPVQVLAETPDPVGPVGVPVVGRLGVPLPRVPPRQVRPPRSVRRRRPLDLPLPRRLPARRHVGGVVVSDGSVGAVGSGVGTDGAPAGHRYGRPDPSGRPVGLATRGRGSRPPKGEGGPGPPRTQKTFVPPGERLSCKRKEERQKKGNKNVFR